VTVFALTSEVVDRGLRDQRLLDDAVVDADAEKRVAVLIPVMVRIERVARLEALIGKAGEHRVELRPAA
jgi:hypothetical protein